MFKCKLIVIYSNSQILSGIERSESFPLPLRVLHVRVNPPFVVIDTWRERDHVHNFICDAFLIVREFELQRKGERIKAIEMGSAMANITNIG